MSPKFESFRDLPPALQKVRVRFTTDCIHTGLPFKAGDEIVTDSHWADSIEAIGSGHRVTDTPPAEKAKES